jgi:hypothetical protein
MRIAMLLLGMIALAAFAADANEPATQPARDGGWFVLSAAQQQLPAHHTRHAEMFGRGDLPEYNLAVLKAVDRVQGSAAEGGGYFIGVHAKPAESPIGYRLALFDRALLNPPRATSYCSGSAYTAFIESLNLIFPGEADRARLSPERLEALRMQEPDGSRREDDVKAWGYWNADGWGTDFCLVQYLGGAGTVIKPIEARPGDFMNISWKSGNGHSVVFLGFFVDSQGRKSIRYWSSQTGTNGLGDQSSLLTKVREVKTVRLTHPQRIFEFDVNASVDLKVPGNSISW